VGSKFLSGNPNELRRRIVKPIIGESMNADTFILFEK